MAALRNTVIGLMRWAGYPNMAAACRRFAAQPRAALHLIGIALENCMPLPENSQPVKSVVIAVYFLRLLIRACPHTSFEGEPHALD